MSLSIEELSEQVNALKAIVEKQSQVIAQTGQQLLDIQVKSVRSDMSQVDLKSSGGAKKSDVDFDDFVTNEDIVQLVGELQGQLDFLEDRSIKRIFNASLVESDSKGVIAPLSNRDGESPDPQLFPATVGDFLKIDKSSLVLLVEFYELIEPVDPATLDAEALGNVQNLDEAKQVLNNAQAQKPLEERIAAFSPEQLEELKDELARYLGLKFRTQSGVW